MDRNDSTAEKRFTGIDLEMLDVFRRDAAKAVAAMREALGSGDMKHYTATVHAMKSALACIGESEALPIAFMLEKAGLSGDADYIRANSEKFMRILGELVSVIPNPAAEEDDSGIVEDRAYLAGQLRITQFACEDYDAEMACEALDMLKEKQWKKETAEAIRNIREIIYLHSDFERAADICEKMAG